MVGAVNQWGKRQRQGQIVHSLIEVRKANSETSPLGRGRREATGEGATQSGSCQLFLKPFASQSINKIYIYSWNILLVLYNTYLPNYFDNLHILVPFLLLSLQKYLHRLLPTNSKNKTSTTKPKLLL
ncbi:MAG: hypothetical protein LBN20_01285 [Endomicrobium sp.]|jgi:hypothetical protein|nr:hypothetical protein [Endomicrobium sp.]